jgi:opine dehydrogenase
MTTEGDRKMKITILGGGNGSFAAAGDFALQGHDVRLWRRDSEAVAAHRAAGSRITVKDSKGRHEAQLALVTSDMAEAVRGTELILCPAPAFAQDDIARALAPHLTDGQVVFLPPATFGSMIFAQAARDAGNLADVAFAETGTLPWLTRKHGPFEVAITIRAKRLPVGVFPLKNADHALAVIGKAFPGVIEPCGDALSGALMNAGPIIHPPLIVMNAGPIEHFERWDIHKEGTQASIRRVTDKLDAERVAIREALGYGAPHFPIAHHYAKEGEQWMYGRGSHDRLTDSGDWRERLILTEHRYMREDLHVGLSFFTSVARLAGVATPLMTAFLAIGGAVCSEDFLHGGRTLESFGLGGMDKAALQRLLKEGFAP